MRRVSWVRWVEGMVGEGVVAERRWYAERCESGTGEDICRRWMGGGSGLSMMMRDDGG